MEKKLAMMEVERFAIHDGPGIRSTVFLQGCPLRCPWCANPESQTIGKKRMYYEKKCTGCGRCLSNCQNHALSVQDGKLVCDKKLCTQCGNCQKACLNDAVSFSGIEMSVEEVKQAKLILEKIKNELKDEKIPFIEEIKIGVMIETPAAVMISGELAREADFFSIGTNDLSQYTLAIDRQNTKLDPFFDPHHPAILRMIQMVVENAHKAGIWAGICGELGADQELTKEFLAMGVDELSVSPGSILPLRKIILETNVAEYKAGKKC